jgi:hypothetical protein
LHYHHTANGTKPLDRDSALQLAQPPPGIDRTLWLYELCRFLISQCNSLIIGFLFDTPACSATTCPEMRASEWQFLCAVHEQPKSCCAIDYCCHTLDWAANVVTDQKLFPSRFVVVSDTNSKNVGVKNLVNVFRRLHRIFAHAWFQHRSVFWVVEGQTGLYVFFKSVCDLYDLLPAENYKLPPEAEGLEAPSSEPEPERPAPIILKAGSQEDSSQVGRTNTRRHIRSSPSTGSAVTTVIEADEEETDGVTQRVKELQISTPETVAEEPEVAEVPVIVEQSVMAHSPLDNSAPVQLEPEAAEPKPNDGELPEESEPKTDVEEVPAEPVHTEDTVADNAKSDETDSDAPETDATIPPEEAYEEASEESDDKTVIEDLKEQEYVTKQDAAESKDEAK